MDKDSLHRMLILDQTKRAAATPDNAYYDQQQAQAAPSLFDMIKSAVTGATNEPKAEASQPQASPSPVVDPAMYKQRMRGMNF